MIRNVAVERKALAVCINQHGASVINLHLRYVQGARHWNGGGLNGSNRSQAVEGYSHIFPDQRTNESARWCEVTTLFAGR
jgi:hypothetical protein